MSKKLYDCPKCDQELTMWAQLTIEAPARYLNRITKKAIVTKEFVIWSCDWEAVTLRCHKCGYSDKGQSKYIKQLTAERDHWKKVAELMSENWSKERSRMVSAKSILNHYTSLAGGSNE